MAEQNKTIADLFVIGGGINGCGIARDAAGRGLSVTLAEMGDLASATSSASTKLFHGGLRYLDYFEFRLVREALQERETLLRAMPHISWPMRFVLPYHGDIRFDATTPSARLLGLLMPWLRGRRPAWLIRFGLALYDRLGGRQILPGSCTLDLTAGAAGAPLQDKFTQAFEYSDCWVEDSRLVVLNARDAEARGAQILTRTKVIATRRHADHWEVDTLDRETGLRRTHRARALVNAAGPWVKELLSGPIALQVPETVRLVRGSHIVVPRLYDHDKAYFLQGTDGRIVFALPFEGDFTLIGTTDLDHTSPDDTPDCSAAERDYLLAFANRYFKRDLGAQDVVWTYSGVRPLYDDGAGSASAATRDYVLSMDHSAGAPVLSVFGGKITTYRRLAESAMDRLATVFAGLPGHWTAGVALPGGDFPVDGVADQIAALQRDYPFLDTAWAQRLIRAYGTEAWDILGNAKTRQDLGQDFGADLSEVELIWLMRKEYARSVEDVIWRRSKLGLRLSADQIDQISVWMAGHRVGSAAA
jgi:glycerol-3-phosphate dehydrogenase